TRTPPHHHSGGREGVPAPRIPGCRGRSRPPGEEALRTTTYRRAPAGCGATYDPSDASHCTPVRVDEKVPGRDPEGSSTRYPGYTSFFPLRRGMFRYGWRRMRARGAPPDNLCPGSQRVHARGRPGGAHGVRLILLPIVEDRPHFQDAEAARPLWRHHLHLFPFLTTEQRVTDRRGHRHLVGVDIDRVTAHDRV